MGRRGSRPGRHARSSQVTSFDRQLVWLVAGVAAVVAAFASAAPSGVDAADLVYRAGLAAAVTLAAARARRWTWLVLAAVATAVAHGALLVPAITALAISFLSAASPVRYRVAGAVVGALSVGVLLRQPTIGFHGASALIGALAVLPVLVSGHRMCRSRDRRRQRWAVGVVGGAGLAATAAFALAALFARSDLQHGADQAQAALASARRGDSAATQAGLRDAEAALGRGRRLTGAWWAAPARLVPLVGQQARAIGTVADEGRKVVTSARVTAEVGDYEQLKYRSGEFDLQRIRELRRPIAASARVVERVDRRLAELDRGWLLPPLGDRIDRFAAEIRRAVPEADMASSVVAVAPGLLGGDGPRRYFVAFITPSELRGAGGFIGNYGELTAGDGRVRLTRSGPIAELINAAPRGARRLDGPADYLRRYGQFAPADFFQDVTFSPHFPFDADVIEQLYPQSGGGTVDGVISIDPVALASLLRFTGPIQVPGLDTPLDSRNAADILLRRQYVQPGSNADRKDLLVEASRITFEQLTTGDLPAPQELARVLGPMVRQRRIMLHSVRPPEQGLFRHIGADGALPSTPGDDVVAVASQNSGNNKIDAYLHREVVYRPVVDPASGAVRATAEIRLRNEAPSSGLPPIVLGNRRNLPNGTNALRLSVYSPHGLREATLDGRPVPMDVGSEAGLEVYSTQLAIPAGATQVLRLELAGAVDLRGGYRLTFVPQPMVHPDRMAVDVEAAGPWRAVPGPHEAPLGPAPEISRYEVKFER